MLENRNYFTLYMLFWSVTGFIDRWTGIVDHVPVIKLHNTYLDLVYFLTDCKHVVHSAALCIE